MPKYETGGSIDAIGGDSCELCGAKSDTLSEANIAEADLLVCSSCTPHDDSQHNSDNTDREDKHSEKERRKRAAQNTAQLSPLLNGDSSHWEKHGTGYNDDPLPYLVNGYGSVLAEARREAGLQLPEFADAVGVPEAHVLAVEQERANKAGVGGSVVRAIENDLGIRLIDESTGVTEHNE
jgi:ribosome-binding protein aMBF1 (putative translation factor)